MASALTCALTRVFLVIFAEDMKSTALALIASLAVLLTCLYCVVTHVVSPRSLVVVVAVLPSTRACIYKILPAESQIHLCPLWEVGWVYPALYFPKQGR